MKFQNLSVKRLFGRVAMELVLSMSGITIALAVAGISCISPLAPAQDTAVESKLDSVYARDASRRQSQSILGAYFLNKSS